VLARLLPHWLTVAHRIGKPSGGALLPQLVLIRPEFVSWKETVPMLVGAAAGLPSSCVVHASVNDGPFDSLTVTFSLVGVVL
jgi:hypothetical protein